MAWIAVVIVLAIFIPPLVKLESSKKTIIDGISRAVGRQVTASDVSLRLFPQPGFDLRHLVVGDDPAFSAEPMLQASEVTATLRLSSLWRWRLEIGSLSLKSPVNEAPWSLNLVRAADGRWNVASLLTRAAQTPSAPTAKRRPESRPRFPYIQGEGGRVNFKSGMEKTPYALNEADFALWLASENEWNLRLRARPMRTDANLSDTGAVEISGALGRAARLEDMPLRLHASLRGAQLGQLTRLVYGRDRGWRGTVNIATDLSGSPQDLRISGTSTVDDFRRYDIIVPDNLHLDARCSGQFRWQGPELSDIACQVQNGTIALRGKAAGWLSSPNYDVSVVARSFPLSELARLARHAKFALPPDLAATGNLDAEFLYQTAASGWSGSGSTSDFALHSGVLGQELTLGTVRFAVAAGDPRLTIDPFSVAFGGSAPATVRGSLWETGYDLEAQGDADLRRAFQVARGLGIHAPSLAASGSAKLDLRISGNWSGFAAPVATGSIQLRNVVLPLKGVNAPAHVRSATAVLHPDEIQVQNLSATFDGVHVAVDGWVVLPRACDPAQVCPARFDLHANQLAVTELNRLLNLRLQRPAWYRLLVPDAVTGLGKLQAQGRIHVDHFAVTNLDIDQAASLVQLRDGRLWLSQLRGNVLGGKLRGRWQADFSGPEPEYSGSGTLERISLGRVAALMRHPWGTGNANGRFTLKLSGWGAADLEESAEGTLDFEWHDGVLQSIALDGNGGPLRLKHFAGRALLKDNHLEFQPSKMETPEGIYMVSGTAALGRLDLKLTGGASRAYGISGTLANPRVSALPASATQAALGK